MAWPRDVTDAKLEEARQLAGEMLKACGDTSADVVMLAGAIIGAHASLRITPVAPYGNAEVWKAFSECANDLVLAGNGPVVG